MTSRISGTEKQRDDALEALVLQQEIAEELERERKRIKKEVATLQHNESVSSRQRDEAQRVVLHLRALISGQTHHMEHIVRTLSTSPELAECIESYQDDGAGLENLDEKTDDDKNQDLKSSDFNQISATGVKNSANLDFEAKLRNSNRNYKRFSQMSIIDVADRHLKDKTDAIAHIIRNISEQCAAAVEGLHLAHESEGESRLHTQSNMSGKRKSNLSIHGNDVGSGHESENGDENSSSTHGVSSVPPTPDLILNRSSTAMSIASTITTPERISMNYNHAELPTKILEDSDEDIGRHSESDTGVNEINTKTGVIQRPVGARLNALGAR